MIDHPITLIDQSHIQLDIFKQETLHAVIKDPTINLADIRVLGFVRCYSFAVGTVVLCYRGNAHLRELYYPTKLLDI